MFVRPRRADNMLEIFLNEKKTIILFFSYFQLENPINKTAQV